MDLGFNVDAEGRNLEFGIVILFNGVALALIFVC